MRHHHALALTAAALLFTGCAIHQQTILAKVGSDAEPSHDALTINLLEPDLDDTAHRIGQGLYGEPSVELLWPEYSFKFEGTDLSWPRRPYTHEPFPAILEHPGKADQDAGAFRLADER